MNETGFAKGNLIFVLAKRAQNVAMHAVCRQIGRVIKQVIKILKGVDFFVSMKKSTFCKSGPNM